VQQWHVGKGDTCQEISKVTGVSVEKLIEINKASPTGFNCSNLPIGSVVCLGSEEESSASFLDQGDDVFSHLEARYWKKKRKYAVKVVQSKVSSGKVSANAFYDQGALEETNKARRAVGVGPLSWDHKLASSALQYSQYLASQGCKLVHSHEPGHGENLYAMYGSSGGSTSLANAVQLWVKEKWHWTMGQLNHFTQVVWSGTQKMGCAQGVNHEKNCQVVTCRYWPQGNIIGRKPF
jgi:pathogenesis-related protein 1